MKNTPVKKIQPKKKRKGKFSAFLFLMFWMLIIVMFSGLAINQASRYNNYKNELDKVTAELERERKIYDELLDQKIYYDSDAYIEKLAREQLGYVKPDEIVFINIPD